MPRGRQLRPAALLLILVSALAACSHGASNGSPTSASTGPHGSAIATVQTALRDALAARSWPVLKPDFTHPTDKDNHGCAWDNVPPIAQCTWGRPTAPHTFYLVGDSTSAAYLPSFAGFIGQIPSWKMIVRSDSGCPFSTTPAPEGHGLDPDAGSAACTAHNEKVVAEITSVRPDMVVFTSVSGAPARIPGKQAELERIAPYVGKIVVLPTSPPLQDPKKCDTAGGSPSACISPVPAAYAGWLRNFATVARAVHGVFLDPSELFCVEGRCPAFVTTIPKTDDGVHMTVDYAAFISPAVHELFTAANLLP